MGKEILAIPEDSLRDVISIIRAGIMSLGKTVKKEVRDNLEQWCKDEEDYLNQE